MAKADLHVHSKFSNRPSEWFLQRLGASKSYTHPDEIYEKAKKKGMTFVTITDHNTMDGSLYLADKYEDAFTGVQTTTYFPENGCKIHLLVWGLTGDQFEEIQTIRPDIYDLRSYLIENKLAHSVAHAASAVNNRLNIDVIEKLVVMFDVFESINASISFSSNSVLYQYLKYLTEDSFHQLAQRHNIRPQGGRSWIKGFTGGSDDHSGLFISSAYTMANAFNKTAFLEEIRKAKSFAKGRSNTFHSLTFTVYKVASDFSRSKSKTIGYSPLANLPSILFGEDKPSLLDRLAILGMGAEANYKRHLAELIKDLKTRNYVSTKENMDLVYDKIATIVDEMLQAAIKVLKENIESGDFFQVTKELMAALPGIFLLVPFFTSMKHLSGNRQLLAEMQKALPIHQNKKILWFTDSLVDMNGPSVTLKNMGWAFYANGIDVQLVTSLREEEVTEELPPNTINLPRIYDFELPYYSQYIIKVPSVLKAMRKLSEYEPDEIFISTPGPVGLLGLLMSKLMTVKSVGIYHTDFTNELSEITDRDDTSIELTEDYLRWFYTQMDEVKVPTQEYISILSRRGFDPDKMKVFPRLIDHELFRFVPEAELNGGHVKVRPGINLVYVGRVSKDKNLEFLVDVFKEARKMNDKINLIVAGDGPYLQEMKDNLSEYEGVVFLGRQPHQVLPQIYSQGHFLVFPSTTDTFGMVVLESQCCELPAIVSDVGGPHEIVKDEETGFVVPAMVRSDWVRKILWAAEIVESHEETYSQMCKKSRERATATYGWESVLRELTSEILIPVPVEFQEK